MNRLEFVYWLQGFFEIREHKTLLTKRQIDMIQRHLLLAQPASNSEVPKAVLNNAWQVGVYLNWLKNTLVAIQNSNYTDARLMADIELKLKEQFRNVTAVDSFTPEDNPFLAGYEPLGDIYSTQRLC